MTTWTMTTERAKKTAKEQNSMQRFFKRRKDGSIQEGTERRSKTGYLFQLS